MHPEHRCGGNRGSWTGHVPRNWGAFVPGFRQLRICHFMHCHAPCLTDQNTRGERRTAAEVHGNTRARKVLHGRPVSILSGRFMVLFGEGKACFA